MGAINRRSQELAAIIERSLTQEARALLEDLLTQERLVGDTVPGKTSAYKLTLMKNSRNQPNPPVMCRARACIERGGEEQKRTKSDAPEWPKGRV